LKTKGQTILYYTLFILSYVGIYFVTSMILMGYEDFWDDSRGQIWTLETMNLQQKVAYLLWFVPNFPLGLLLPKGLLNLIAVCFLTPVLLAWTILEVSKAKKEKIKRNGIIINSILTVAAFMTAMYLFW
jgi:hypothetical protein